jgi:hypothetical protein
MASPFVPSLASGLLLLLLAVPAAALEAATPAEPLTGRVLPPAAAAVARVEVWPQCPPADETARPLATVRPGADGRFQIVPPDEPFRLRLEAPGFLPVEAALSSGAAALPPLRMQRAEPLELTLAGPDGAPLAGLPLVLFPQAPATSGSEGWTPAGRTAVTGPDGRATVARRSGEILTLLPRTPRFLGFYPLAAASPQRLVLTPGRPLALSAVDPAGRPVAGARVRLWEWTIGRTDSRGRLELHQGADLAGTTLTVEDEAGARAEVAIPAGGGGAALTAVLRPGREVAGRVLDAATRQPVADARLDLGCRVAARTAADGGFRLAVRATEKGALASAPGYLPAFLDLEDSAAAGPFTVTLQPAAALTVRVVDEQGAAVAGAQIVAFPSPGGDAGPLQGTSGTGGTARLGPAAVGRRYEVTAERDGFAAGRVVVPAVRAPTTAVEVVLTRGTTVVGRLVGDGGEPVAGGEVSLQREADTSAGLARTLQAPLRAAADAEGRFALHRLTAGRYRLTVRAPGRSTAIDLPVEIPEGVAEVDLGTLSLAAGAALEGRVVDDSDRPVAGARIVASNRAGALPAVESGADGGFRVPDLEPGQAALRVQKDGFVEVTLSGLTVPSPEPVVVRLRTARALTGRVVGPRGQGVAGAAVRRLGGDARAVPSSSASIAHTDADGRFRAEGLEIGPLTLQVEAAGYLTRRLQTEIPADRDGGPLEIVLEPGAVVEGRVTTGGRPLVGGAVSGAPVGTGPVAGVVVLTDREGRYRLEGLATGRHAIEVSDNDGRHAREELEVQPGRQVLDIDLDAGEVSGRVVAASGVPAAGTEVQIMGPQHRIVRTGLDGTFAFRSLLPGSYRLTARHPDAGEAAVPEVEVAGQPVVLPDLVLDAGEGCTVFGRVLGLALRDLAQAWVRAVPIAPEPGYSAVQATSRVDSDGSYRLLRLVPGTWRIEAGAGERRPVQRQLQLAAGEQAELDLELADGATLSGRVTVDNQPLAGLRVVLTPDGGETRTGGDGSFTVRDVRLGTYTLEVTLDGGLSWQQPVGVEGDQTVEIEIATGVVAGRVTSEQGPVAGVRVTAQGPAGTPTPGVVTDDDGAYRFPRLLPGRYRLRTHTGGAADATAEVTVTAGDEAWVELQLP